MEEEMGKWMGVRVNKGMYGRGNVWMGVRVNKWMYGKRDVWMDERMDERVKE